MRTREQIIADCEKRFEQMRTEAEKPSVQYPCKTCKWAKRDEMFVSVLTEWRCQQPLVKGLSRRGPRAAGFGFYGDPPFPCGIEKALWESKPTLCERIINFLTGDAA